MSRETRKFIFYAGLAILLNPLLFLLSYFRRRRAGSGLSKILVVPILTRVGDQVCSTPVYRAIKLKYPEAKLVVVVAGKSAGIIKNNRRIDRIININDNPFKGFWGRGRLMLFLFRGNFDCVISLATSPWGSVMALFSCAPIRIKTAIKVKTFAERLTDWFNTSLVPYEQGMHLPSHYCSLLAIIGISGAPVIKEVFVLPEHSAKVTDFFTSSGLNIYDFVVGITVSAGNSIKIWPAERFAKLADLLVSKFSAKVIFIDMPANINMVQEVRDLMSGVSQSKIAVDFTLEELPALIKSLSLFIAVDTGSIYIAHALGVPLVDIVGPVHPDEQPPSDLRSILVLPPKSISPTSFVLTPPPKRANHINALLSISVEDVIRACGTLISRGVIRRKKQDNPI